MKEQTEIGRFRSSKTTVENVFSFKDKEVILSSGHKLKGTEVAVRKDFSVPIRHACRKVLEFAKQHMKHRIKFGVIIFWLGYPLIPKMLPLM